MTRVIQTILSTQKANLTVRFFCLSLLLSSHSGCSAEDYRLYTSAEPHMGTEFTFQTWARPGQEEALSRTSRKAFDRVAQLNQIFSDYLPESEINNFARAPIDEPFRLSPDLYKLFSIARDLAEETGNTFDVTSGPITRLWHLSRKNRRLPPPEHIDRAKNRIGFEHLTFDPDSSSVTKHREGMLFNFGGIAKGYAADAALSIFREAGFSRTLVAASGDIVAGDPPPGERGWEIDLETHQEPGTSQPVSVRLANAAVSTSGDRHQYLELEGTRYSHIVSPVTGLGLIDQVAASVIAPTATQSDSYATTVTLLGEKEGLHFIENKRGVECRIVALRNGQEKVVSSHGFSQFQEKEIIEESPVTAP